MIKLFQTKLFFLFVSISFSTQGQNYVTTYAGNGNTGFINGAINVSEFNNPFGMCIDKLNNLYVADGDNNCIRKINISTGLVNTFAGTGAVGWKDGSVDSAMFNSPSDLCIDDSGNIFVSDFLNQRIRKISSSGIVTTVAGNGVAGFAEGLSTNAKFNYPRGICVDKSGNLYIGDSWNHRIRKIDPTGNVSTYAGGGPTIGVGSVGGLVDANDTSARFYTPSGLTIDEIGNIFVADAYNHRIRKIDTSRVVSTYSGSGGTGPGLGGYQDGNLISAIFNTPTELFVDTLNHILYISDTFNNRVRKADMTAGVVSTFAGNGTAGFTNDVDSLASFNYPRGIVIDSSRQKIYVVDYNNQSIRLISPDNTSQTLEIISTADFKLYPNPSNRTIYLPELENINYSYKIYDINGRLISEKSLNSSKEINIINLIEGTYMLKIMNDSGEKIDRKFIKVD